MGKFTPKPPPAGRNKWDIGARKMPIRLLIPDDFNNVSLVDGKLMIETPEQRHRRLGGCGDPNCEWCNPKNGSDDELNGKAPGDGSGGGGGRAAPSAAPPAPPRITPGMERRLEAAREPVAGYILKAKHSVGWEEVIGNEKARTALIEAIELPVKYADVYKRYNMRPTKGVLLYGPPGCGKTMFGKAAAAAMAQLYGTSHMELMVINGPSIQSPWVGKTEETIRQIFAYARAYHEAYGHRLVIFIDEADAILKARANSPMWNASNVATFLTEMDGMEDSGAFVILATNRPDELDEALLRDGRCDRKIKVERPTYEACLTIAGRELAGLGPIAATASITDMVDYFFMPTHMLQKLKSPNTGLEHHFLLSHTVNGAMMVGMVNRAKGIAFRREIGGGGATGLTTADLVQAVDEVFAEAQGLDHDYALREFVETIAMPSDDMRKMRA